MIPGRQLRFDGRKSRGSALHAAPVEAGGLAAIRVRVYFAGRGLDRQADGNLETRGGGMRQRPSNRRQRKKKHDAEKNVRPLHPPNKCRNGAEAYADAQRSAA